MILDIGLAGGLLVIQRDLRKDHLYASSRMQ